ncbi:MAG TPA: GldG family protein [Candidatus Sulfotelmatobacter sp.]|nr:GldG family protein [Candidatus Sulfotelmatobacter sp.]
MQKKSLQTILYSSAGVVVMFVLVVAVNVISGAFPYRADLTQEKTYSLSAGTKTVLKSLDGPVTIRFYCTQGESAPETVFLKDYAREVEDLLHEYKFAAGKNIIIQKFDAEPDSDAEDSARMDGLEPQQLSDGDNFYLGLSISMADQRVAIPFLDPNREKSLEYDITRAITEVQEPDKATIGIMSALPVFGEQPNPEMQMQNQQGAPAWTLVQQLQQDFNVQQIPMDADKIDDSVKTLLVIYPGGISDKAQYAIDQFVLRGGKLIAFLDPQSTLMAHQQQNPMMGGQNTSATLDKLLKAWGIQFDTSKVVADLDFKMELDNGNGQPIENPAWLALTPEGINQNDIVTSEMDSLWLPTVGAFTGQPAAGLKETVLLHSSKDAELTDAMMAGMGADAIMNGFKATGENYALAIRLTGKFHTAFPDGEPKDDSDTNTVAKANDDSLKESKVETSVVLVGDSDMLADDFSVQKTDTPVGEMVNPLNGNLDFAQNLVEQMAGNNNLIGLRSRASMSRPFTRIKQMEAAAEASGQAKIDALQKTLNDTEEKLNDLQQQKSDKDQKLILSPAQEAEIDNFRKQEAETNRELRQAQKDLRREVVSLEMRLTWLNILAMPCAVTAVGMTTAFIKRKKTSAK